MIVGILIGGIIGIIIMCAAQINKENKYDDLVKAIRDFGDNMQLYICKCERIGPDPNLKGLKEYQEAYEFYFEEELK